MTNFFLQLFLITSFFSSCKTEDERLNIDDEFSISIPFKYETNSELLEMVKKTNSDVIDLFQVEYFGLPKTLLTISCYSSSKSISLDSAFYYKTVGTIPDNIGTAIGDYKLISYDKYKYNEINLYRKVSSPIEGKCSVMYYFMKNGISNKLYEIKVVGELRCQSLLVGLAEKIALTVKII